MRNFNFFTFFIFVAFPFCLGSFMALVANGAMNTKIQQSGMIKVASGEYKCELIEQQDKTTEWECESAEE